MLVELQPEFDEVLQPFGNHAVEFFLAASLYHARKISFSSISFFLLVRDLFEISTASE